MRTLAGALIRVRIRRCNADILNHKIGVRCVFARSNAASARSSPSTQSTRHARATPRAHARRRRSLRRRRHQRVCVARVSLKHLLLRAPAGCVQLLACAAAALARWCTAVCGNSRCTHSAHTVAPKLSAPASGPSSRRPATQQLTCVTRVAFATPLRARGDHHQRCRSRHFVPRCAEGDEGTGAEAVDAAFAARQGRQEAVSVVRQLHGASAGRRHLAARSAAVIPAASLAPRQSRAPRRQPEETQVALHVAP